ncbi:MAG: hypothetical protein IJM15_02570 [Erysipelotrichaceae bacterium]|nr:hypothetical protein [Erysipelotrichaceae bacterium]
MLILLILIAGCSRQKDPVEDEDHKSLELIIASAGVNFLEQQYGYETTSKYVARGPYRSDGEYPIYYLIYEDDEMIMQINGEYFPALNSFDGGTFHPYKDGYLFTSVTMPFIEPSEYNYGNDDIDLNEYLPMFREFEVAIEDEDIQMSEKDLERLKSLVTVNILNEAAAGDEIAVFGPVKRFDGIYDYSQDKMIIKANTDVAYFIILINGDPRIAAHLLLDENEEMLGGSMSLNRNYYQVTDDLADDVGFVFYRSSTGELAVDGQSSATKYTRPIIGRVIIQALAEYCNDLPGCEEIMSFIYEQSD